MYSYIVGFICKFDYIGYLFALNYISCNRNTFFIYKSNANSIYSGTIVNGYFTFCVTFNHKLFHNSYILINNKFIASMQCKGKAKMPNQPNYLTILNYS